jgi:beta-glucosidase
VNDHVGAILSGGGEAPDPNTPKGWADMTNAIQRYGVTNTRLHIPILYGADAVHGHNNVLGATIFPHNIGLAATWDAGLVHQVTAGTAAAVRATGVHWTFSPVSDVGRDIRWGRLYETFGEDPVLAASMVSSAVQGYQGDSSLSSGVAATAKHFLGYSEPLNGHDRTFAELPLRYLRETFYPPFQGAVDNHVASVMVNSGSVNGVPVHASHYLLNDVLRGQMGFTGFTVSDWGDVDALYSRYHVATDEKDAIRVAVMAGIDMAMVPYDVDTFTTDLISLVKDGTVPMSRIDEAVGRILRVKLELGLMDHPYVDATTADGTVLGADRTLALKAAEESLTLLSNDNNVLPLSGKRRVLLTGSGANSVPDQMGGWTIGWQGIPSGASPPATTVLRGLKATAASGTSITLQSAGDVAQLVRAAKRADVAVVVASEPPYAEGQGDTETAALQASDATALSAMRSAGIPTVLVVVAGRPLILSSAALGADAILMAWLPGTEGGSAIARALFGKYDPSGHLPISWPKDIGQEPLVYEHLPGTDSATSHEYDPLYPFGFGMSYTNFSYDNLQVTPTTGPQGTVRVSVTVRNTGKRAGDALTQVYAKPDAAPILVPSGRLVAFGRVHLAAGQSQTVTLDFPVSELATVQGDVLGTGAAEVLPGHYSLTVSNLTGAFDVS